MDSLDVLSNVRPRVEPQLKSLRCSVTIALTTVTFKYLMRAAPVTTQRDLRWIGILQREEEE